MTTTNAKKAPQKIEGLGYDENFAGIDLNSMPHLKPLVDDPDGFHDPRFSQLDTSGQGAGSVAFKRFLSRPDREAVKELRSPETLEKFDEETKGTIIQVCGERFKIFLDSNGLWHGKGILDGEKHHFTAPSRGQVLGKLVTLAQEQASIPIRDLTPNEELEIIRLCQSGDRIAGIGVYLKHRLGEAVANDYDDPWQMASDTKLLAVMNEAAEFTWFHSNPHAQDSPDWHRYKEYFLAGRPVTHQLLDAAYLAYQDFVERQSRPGQEQLQEPAENTPQDPRELQTGLEELSDDEVARLMHATTREYATAVRTGRC